MRPIAAVSARVFAAAAAAILARDAFATPEDSGRLTVF